MSGFIAELPEGWLQVKVPLPFSLKWVNSYMVPEERGYTIIDPGLRTEEAVGAWSKVMQDRGIAWLDISRIVLTHQHPDHYGLAGYMQERSGAPVYMSSRAHAYARRLWGEDSDYPEALESLFLQHGMPEGLMDDIVRNLAEFVSRVSPQPVVQYIEAGEKLQLGGRQWQLIDAPGHAFGGLCFYQPELGWMLCGDQVLPHITPNVSVVPGEERDPLGCFLHSLEELKAWEVTLALPGHREPFTGFRERIEQLQGHHDRRLAAMEELLKGAPMSAFAVCETSFGSHLRRNPHNLRFAMAETLAHLFHLEGMGRVDAVRKDGTLEYEASPTGIVSFEA
ncbi:MBL fold metallo-hydrolase [Paenibacillus sp. J5C_2022]|uniref:MBL fold metallo-hydrolase n=1 Tax=Paenibacillus sp. J5C2022 TaxID=2977129 RepID=UPI0021CEE5AF|nr:MBL fold metallo-hydrolase [Paenibacillus sp. J5C2022]MCU6712459.1 MBL fold metallo-hydrolase [Paenibacillus sp. J5C2022]